MGAKDEDLRVDVFRSGIGCPVTVQITHKPTGLVRGASAPDQNTAYFAARTDLCDALRQTRHAEP